MFKILFVIHDLGHGGAEKVLVNLVNNMNRTKFEISVLALFGGGINEQFLKNDIRYMTVFPKSFPGNSHVMKLLSPAFLHRWFIKDEYDIEISYLEGPSARIVSGCKNPKTKTVTWVHCTMHSSADIARSYRSITEAEVCYNALDKIIFVSDGVRKAFLENSDYHGSVEVIYNTVESHRIRELSHEDADEIISGTIGLIAVGTLKPVKGFDRLLYVTKRLYEDGYPIHLYLLGDGPQKNELIQLIHDQSLENVVSLLGYQVNPYKYISKCALFVCSSFSEGFSTAVTESLIVGTPVCTMEVSGMKELLGNNEYGIITGNDENSFYKGIRMLLDDPVLLKHYKKQAIRRGERFSVEQTVGDVERMLTKLMREG